MARGKTLRAMTSTANEQALTALQQVVGDTESLPAWAGSWSHFPLGLRVAM